MNRWRTILRYLLAFPAVGAATALTHWLSGLGDSGTSPLLFAAVLFCAWYGGLGPGLLATLLSGLATAYLLASPAGHGNAAIYGVGAHLLRLGVFTSVALLASALHAAMKRASEASRRAEIAAQSASAAKSRFLAMVSHELRTPLSPVLMVTEMLEEDESLSPAVRADIRTIRRNVDLELRLIEDLVDLTRIGSGKLLLRSQRVDLRQCVDESIDVCRGDVEDKALELAVELPPGPCDVMGDPVRLQQVFWNLVRNAVKFTPAGGSVRVRVGSTGGRATVEIADSGIGIDPDRLATIFEAFEQGAPDIQARFGGLGLGLAICQALLQAHHGSIAAASAGVGHGATFTVRLPLAPGDESCGESRSDEHRYDSSRRGPERPGRAGAAPLGARRF